MTAALPPAERNKLGKVLALLDNTSEGERDAAIRAATKILERHGLRWSEVLNLQPPPKREPLHATWRTTCHRLQERHGLCGHGRESSSATCRTSLASAQSKDMS